jgi:hypothetical protein
MRLAEFNLLLQRLVGQRVVAKTIAGNSISLWFDAHPKESDARGIWVDPPWRIETEQGTESSSDGFPGEKQEDETDNHYRDRFEKCCANSDCLKGLQLASVRVDERTSDLTLAFADGRILRSFSTDLEYENWHYSDHGARRRYGVWVTGVEIEETDA